MATIEEVVDKAIDVLGSVENAEIWFFREVWALGFEKPVCWMDTEERRQEVYNLLGRIEYGVFS